MGGPLSSAIPPGLRTAIGSLAGLTRPTALRFPAGARPEDQVRLGAPPKIRQNPKRGP